MPLVKKLVFAAFLLSAFSFSLGAQNTKVFLDGATRELIIKNAAFIPDSNCSLTFPAVSFPALASRFISKPALEPGANTCYWLKFQVKNSGGKAGEWLIVLDKWQYVDLYYSLNGQSFIKKITGTLVPYLQRAFPLANHNLVPLDLNAGDSVICYARLRTDNIDDQTPDDLSFSIVQSQSFQHDASLRLNLVCFFFGIYLIMLLYNLFIYVSTKERGYLYYLGMLFCLILALLDNSGYANLFLQNISRYPSWLATIDITLSSVFGSMMLLFTKNFLRLKEKQPVMNHIFNGIMVVLGLLVLLIFSGNLALVNNISSVVGLVTVALIVVAATRSYAQKHPSSLWFLLAFAVFAAGVAGYLLMELGILPSGIFSQFVMETGSSLEAVLLSLALANRINILKRENEASNLKIISQLNEYTELQAKLNRDLEEKVVERTRELKESQQQLLQKEKLAALGELTAGIAHEIQNPLNFVNNFSEVNVDLLDEMADEIDQGNLAEAKLVVADIRANTQKVIEHGKRAGNIVKNMLQHSGTGSGKKEEANLNALAEEYFKLSYHAVRLNDKSFQADFETSFDTVLTPVHLSKQEMGRVLFNIYNNAFYAMAGKKMTAPANYEPTVVVTTRQTPAGVELSIRDNGPGIPQTALNKIFQPFFTTKPTGEGTGLGLSLAYDTVKAHGGEIKVNTLEGEFAEFIITFPV
jgi:signal transduction histidine kinase